MAFSLFLFVGMVSNAQTCSKKKAGAKCCAKKSAMKASTTTTAVAAAMVEADIAAEADETISKRVCEKSGAVSYYQKAVCEKSGKVSYNEVEYDEASKAFTQVASASMEKDVETGAITDKSKKVCTPAEKAACAKKGIKCASKDKKAGI